MNISRIFIERPVASSVLFAFILFFGWLGFQKLPVNDLPNVDFPTISVTAVLPGGSPEVMANTVALPLDFIVRHLAGLELIEIGSNAVRNSLAIERHQRDQAVTVTADTTGDIKSRHRRAHVGVID